MEAAASRGGQPSEVLYSDSSTTVVRYEKDGALNLELRHYPLSKRYANVVTTVVKLQKGQIEVWAYWDGWGVDGSLTGCKMVARASLTAEEYGALASAISRARTPEDFEKIVSAVSSMEDRAREEWEGALTRLVEEIERFAWFAQKVESIRDPETKERLIEDVKRYVENWLAD